MFTVCKRNPFSGPVRKMNHLDRDNIGIFVCLLAVWVHFDNL